MYQFTSVRTRTHTHTQTHTQSSWHTYHPGWLTVRSWLTEHPATIFLHDTGLDQERKATTVTRPGQNNWIKRWDITLHTVVELYYLSSTYSQEIINSVIIVTDLLLLCYRRGGGMKQREYVLRISDLDQNIVSLYRKMIPPPSQYHHSKAAKITGHLFLCSSR